MNQFQQPPGGQQFQFQPRTRESTEQRAADTGGDFDRPYRNDITIWKPKSGDNCIRIMPATWQGADYYGHDVYMHYGVGPDHRSSYLCLMRHQNIADPIDQAYNQARREGNTELEKEFRVSHRMAYWIIDRADPDSGPQLWPAPVASFDRSLASQGIDRQTGEVLQIEDPQGGYDVSFQKSGEGIQTKYLAPQIHRRPSPLHHDPATAQAWIDFVVANPIPSVLQFYTYDQIKAAMVGEKVTSEAAQYAPQEQQQIPVAQQPIPQQPAPVAQQPAPQPVQQVAQQLQQPAPQQPPPPPPPQQPPIPAVVPLPPAQQPRTRNQLPAGVGIPATPDADVSY